jgi:F420-0:gamma-glutamyl ligase
MRATAYKTPLIRRTDSLEKIVMAAIPELPERSILVIASKAFATCENRFVAKVAGDEKAQRAQKHELARQEAEWYVDPHSSKYDIMLTIKHNCVWANAGIDESNADGELLLLPADPQASVNRLWEFLRDHYGVKELGITMSDSRSQPLNWGVVGHALAHCGFQALKSYIGQPDLFGRPLKMEQVNVMQAVTVAGAFEMGEGNESQPLAVVSELQPEIVFQDRPPTAEEIAALHIDLADDVFAPILQHAPWQKGGGGK